jgi:hypothetical protein
MATPGQKGMKGAFQQSLDLADEKYRHNLKMSTFL